MSVTADQRRRSTDVDPAAARAATGRYTGARVDADRARSKLERHTRDLDLARARATSTADAVRDAEQALNRARQFADEAAADVTRAEQQITTGTRLAEQTTAAQTTAFAALVTMNPDSPNVCRCYRRDGEPHPIHYGDPA